MAATARAVDLTNVKEGGTFRPRPKPDGDYRLKIVKADDHQPKDKNSPLGWVLTLQVEGDARSTYPYYLSPATNQAWKIRGIMIAAGFSAKAARIKFDPNKLVNKTIGAALIQEEYEGRMKSVIDEVFPASEVGANADEDAPEDDYDDADIPADDDVEVPEDDEPEEEPEVEVKVVTRRRKPAPEPEPEDDDEEVDEEPPPPPVRRKRRAAPAPVVEDEEEEEEEEEPPAPPVRKRRTARKPAPVIEDDDLDDLDTDDL